MKTSEWRDSFLSFIQSRIDVDEWSLDHPQEDLNFSDSQPWNFSDNSNTVGFLPPLRNIDISLPSPKEAQARATQELFILARFDRELKYHELPLNKLEGIWVTLSTLVLASYNKILPPDIQATRGLLGMTVAAQEFPVSVAPAGDKASDWIATLSFSWYLHWLVDVEEGEIRNPYEIKEVRGKVYRSWLDDFENKILDFDGLYAPKATSEPPKPLLVTATPDDVYYGTSVQIDVSGCKAGEQVDITLITSNNARINLISLADSQGKLKIALSLGVESYQLSALGTRSGRAGQASFIVRNTPTPDPIQISASSPTVITGNSYNISSSTWMPNEYLEFYFAEAFSSYGAPVIVRANSSGVWSSSFTMGVPGTYKAKLVGIEGDRSSPELSLTSIYDPNIPLVITFTPNPVSQGVQTTLTVSGGVPEESLVLSGSVTQVAQFNSSGVYTVLLNLPQGTYPVSALALMSGRSGQGSLTVTAPLPTALKATLRVQKTYTPNEIYYVDVTDYIPNEPGMWYAAPGHIDPTNYEGFPWKGGMVADSAGKYTLSSTSGGAGSYWNVFKGFTSGRVSNPVLIVYA